MYSERIHQSARKWKILDIHEVTLVSSAVECYEEASENRPSDRIHPFPRWTVSVPPQRRELMISLA